jgi:hypothetical protein
MRSGGKKQTKNHPSSRFKKPFPELYSSPVGLEAPPPSYSIGDWPWIAPEVRATERAQGRNTGPPRNPLDLARPISSVLNYFQTSARLTCNEIPGECQAESDSRICRSLPTFLAASLSLPTDCRFPSAALDVVPPEAYGRATYLIEKERTGV